MRRGAIIPGLFALAIAVLVVRLRRASAERRPAPVAAPSSMAPLPAAAHTAPAGGEPAEAPPVPRFLSVPWQLVAPPGDGRELEIRFARNGHEELDRVDVQETPTQVFVTVIVRWRLHVSGSFAAETEEIASVALTQPLGERELIHGATDVDDAGGRPLYP